MYSSRCHSEEQSESVILSKSNDSRFIEYRAYDERGVMKLFDSIFVLVRFEFLHETVCTVRGE